MKEHVAKHERHASSCYKCNFETKTLGKLTDHVAKHRSQEWFKCTKCPDILYKTNHLREHENNKHENESL